MTPLSSSGANHVSSVWCPHSSAKSRSSFSLAASASQGALHSLLLLGDFYKNSQSVILSLYFPKNRYSGKKIWGRGDEAGGQGAGSRGEKRRWGDGEMGRIYFKFSFPLPPAPCPLPPAPCPLPPAPCPLPPAPCPLPPAPCPLPPAPCPPAPLPPAPCPLPLLPTSIDAQNPSP